MFRIWAVPSNHQWGMFFAMMQQSNMERQHALEAEYREQLIQRDMDFRLMRMKADQDIAVERARNRALQEANMKAMMDQFMKSQR